MPFQRSDLIRYFTFDSLHEAGIVHAVFTRRGGVSPGPWRSLNVGGSVGDDPARVAENRTRAFGALQRDPGSRFDVWQVHGADVAVARRPLSPCVEPTQADVIITDQPHLTLFMRFADCVPVFLADPGRRAVGLVHAGWQGTVRQAVVAGVQAMRAQFGSRPRDVRAAIGPSIGPDHYEIGEEVIERVRGAYGGLASELLLERDGAVYFDLWRANCLSLEMAGVREFEVAGICTACNVTDWYSHRAERGRTGRFGALIGL